MKNYPIDSWQHRLLKERDENSNKLEKLRIFLTSSSFDDLNRKQQDLLRAQCATMTQLQTILDERIDDLGLL